MSSEAIIEALDKLEERKLSFVRGGKIACDGKEGRLYIIDGRIIFLTKDATYEIREQTLKERFIGWMAILAKKGKRLTERSEVQDA